MVAHVAHVAAHVDHVDHADCVDHVAHVAAHLVVAHAAAQLVEAGGGSCELCGSCWYSGLYMMIYDGTRMKTDEARNLCTYLLVNRHSYAHISNALDDVIY